MRRALWIANWLGFAWVAVLAGETASSLTLYEWMGPAPVVVVGRVVAEELGRARLRVERSLRGDVEEASVVQVDVRRANRDREEYEPRLRLEPATSYMLLLAPSASRVKGDQPPLYQLIRGVRGVREVPLEGAPAFLEAASRFARVQDANDEPLKWKSFEMWLEETNPRLIETSLDQFLKFQRGGAELVPLIRPLLDHPRMNLRERVVRLAGQILDRHPDRAIPERAELESELISRARRDPAVEVRIAATETLAALDGPAAEEILEEISREDPDQAVRLAAEVILYEKRLAREGAGRKAAGGR